MPSVRVNKAKLALGSANLSNREVGERTFEFFYKREVDD